MHNKPYSGLTVVMVALAVSTLLLGGTASAASKPKPTSKKSSAPSHMFRYANDNGITVTSNTIAPEYARKGYQIVTLEGVVLKTIPPEPTQEDRARFEKEKQNQESDIRQREDDKDLLLRYSTVEEIDIARNRKLSEINNKIVILNSNISSLQSQIDIEQKNAAAYERNGQPIPPLLLKKIDDLKQNTKVTEGQLNSRKTEMADETDRFNKETARLKILLQNQPKR